MEFRDKLERCLEEQNFDLVGSVVEDAKNAEDASVRLAAKKLLLDYAYPKLKAVEATVAEPVKVVLVDASQPPTTEEVDPLS